MERTQLQARSSARSMKWCAQEMLLRALEEEVEGFLGHGRYERGGEFRGHRNGHAPARRIGAGVGSVEVRAPRVKDVPAKVNPAGLRSAIIPRYQQPPLPPASCSHGSTWKGCPAGISSRCSARSWARRRRCLAARFCA